ncbi:hypothetical protein CT694_32455 (plasmid) [Bacillus wiedmannii bv. thuringiensis]|nr:hypothetical protein CT694_32455 [Bacillus wiedmannii bv. thuringiensis]
MRKKLISGILSLTFLFFTLISSLPMKTEAAVTNLAFNKTASSSANETSGLTPNLAFDGDTTSKSSRWSSGSFPTPQWITVDLGQIQTFDRVRIYWEYSHAVDYEIAVSNDNKQWTTVKSVTGDKTGGAEIYQFTTQNARYVRMYATKNDPTKWSSISLYEMEVYNGAIPLSLQDVANQQKISINLTKGQTTLPVQTAPKGYEILLAGSENQQVITYKGEIQEPLVDTNVTLSYQLKETATGEVAKIPDTIVTVPGTYQNQAGTNLVPTVIPSLREWYGKVGQTKITNNSRIVIDSANKSELQSIGDLLKSDIKEITGKDLNVVVGVANPGDIFLTYNGGVSRLGDEGYAFDVNDYIAIKGTTRTGVFYGTRTLLQILMQDTEKSNIPKGIAMDYPKYKIRGLSLDVARKFYPMSFLREFAKYMSFYKMNAFQIHLNDNSFRDFDKLDSNGVAVQPKETITLPWEDTYSAFRLESDIPGLTSKDGSYTKDEFRDFQNESASFGVNIIPEIDSPGHSLAFVKARPDLAYGDKKDHLDISNPNTYTFIDSVFKEYLDGPNPVFVGKNVHIGADEYFGNNINEKFRSYIDRYLNIIKSYNKTPIAWGALSQYPGTTPVTKDGTIMEVWNTGFSDPVKALKDGYQIININDADTYIVPAAGYYYDYLNNQNLYNKWEPYMFGSTNVGNGNPNILGGMFAVWNDRLNNGISIFDSFDRMKTSTQVIAEKTWFGKNVNQTYSQFTDLLNKVKEGPDSNLLRNIKSTGDVVLNYNSKIEGNTILDSSPNNYNGQVTPGVKSYYNGTEFTNNNQFINTNLKSIGFPWTVSFDINPKAGNPDDATIFSGEDGVLKLRQKDTGKLGFSRENYNFKFDYVVPTDTWTDITIVGTNKDTKLYVNGVLKQTLQRVGTNFSYDNNSEVDTNKNGPGSKRISMSTFVMPLEKIGGFVGSLGKVKVFNRELSSSEIAKEGVTPTKSDLALGKKATASSEETSTFTAVKAVDGDSLTRWASKYNDNEWLKVDLGENKTFDSVSINWEYARPSSYKVQVSNDDITWTDIIQQENSPAGEETLTFAPVTGRYVKMQGIKRATGYGYSIKDFKVFGF